MLLVNDCFGLRFQPVVIVSRELLLAATSGHSMIELDS
jgi:hypothetical protein